MIYSSFNYVFIFLPIMLLVYFLLGKKLPYSGRMCILLLGSLVFYAYWLPAFLILLLWTVIFNFFYGNFLKHNKSKISLSSGIIIDLLPLLFFKYTNFLIQNINTVFHFCNSSWNIASLPLILPLGISFFTFQEIAYLVDCYQQKAKEYTFLEFSVFIVFWPQLIAGPILHHTELIPQLQKKDQCMWQWDNFILGCSAFILGAAKKMLLADKLSPMVEYGFNHADTINSGAAILAVVCYTFQLYFDFSGYCDMAYGSARLFNIELPFNFLSPYKSRSIQEFWRRWHITLSNWLRDYIYIPLGGSRVSESRTTINLFLTFLIGGIWHGAGWCFVIWGCIHGAGVALCHLWHRTDRKLPGVIAWAITMLTIIAGWVFFRANSVTDAFLLLKKMIFIHGLQPHFQVARFAVSLCVFAVFIVFGMPNSKQILDELQSGKRTFCWGFLIGLLSLCVLLTLLSRNLPESPFLYFQF